MHEKCRPDALVLMKQALCFTKKASERIVLINDSANTMLDHSRGKELEAKQKNMHVSGYVKFKIGMVGRKIFLFC